MLARGGEGFVIALKDGSIQGFEYKQALRQWGAWLAYFKRMHHKIQLMSQREFYTVPAEWPHLFDVSATVQLDHATGEHFGKNHIVQEAKWRRQDESIAQKQAAVLAGRMRMRDWGKKKPTPEEHLVAPEIDPPWKTNMGSAAHLLDTEFVQ